VVFTANIRKVVKMANKKTATTKRTSKSQSAENTTRTRPARGVKPDSNWGTPIEHYPGEPTGKRISEVGDLNEETLDRDAPYNKTYGRQ